MPTGDRASQPASQHANQPAKIVVVVVVHKQDQVVESKWGNILCLYTYVFIYIICIEGTQESESGKEKGREEGVSLWGGRVDEI